MYMYLCIYMYTLFHPCNRVYFVTYKCTCTYVYTRRCTLSGRPHPYPPPTHSTTSKRLLWQLYFTPELQHVDECMSFLPLTCSCSQPHSPLFPPLPSPQPHVRAAAVVTLNRWCEEVTLVPFIEQELLSEALTTENPTLRTEVYNV